MAFVCIRGNYEKLEHLGDAVLQFIVSDFVYHKFPTLHEGHLSVSLKCIYICTYLCEAKPCCPLS